MMVLIFGTNITMHCYTKNPIWQKQSLKNSWTLVLNKFSYHVCLFCFFNSTAAKIRLSIWNLKNENCGGLLLYCLAFLLNSVSLWDSCVKILTEIIRDSYIDFACYLQVLLKSRFFDDYTSSLDVMCLPFFIFFSLHIDVVVSWEIIGRI